MKQYKYAIFDMDGTLIDSMQYWHNLGRDYLISKGKYPEADLNNVIKAMTLKESAEYFQSYYKIDDSVSEIINQVNLLIADHYTYDIQLKRGVSNYLQQLKDQQVLMCIATTSSKVLAKKVCKRLKIDQYFTDIISSDQIGSGKDTPKIYNECIKIMKANKEQTIVFEDAVYAISTLIKADYDCVAVYDESQKSIPADLLSKCVGYIDSFEQLVSESSI